MRRANVWLRRAGWLDVFKILRWRNMSSSRRWMKDGHIIGVFEHLRWFAGTRPQHLFIVESMEANAAVGTVRLDWTRFGSRFAPPGSVNGYEAEIDIVIAPEYRGRKFGRQAIEQACIEASTLGYGSVVAEVHQDNEASLRLFRGEGFVDVNRDLSWLVLGKVL